MLSFPLVGFSYGVTNVSGAFGLVLDPSGCGIVVPSTISQHKPPKASMAARSYHTNSEQKLKLKKPKQQETTSWLPHTICPSHLCLRGQRKKASCGLDIRELALLPHVLLEGAVGLGAARLLTFILVLIFVNPHVAHTHTHIYIYIYIYRVVHL